MAANILDPYIQSGGREIKRSELYEYREGGVKENLCVFCERAHDYHTVYILNPEMHKSLITQTYACSICEGEIEEMIETIYDFSKAEVVRIVIPAKREPYDNDYLKSSAEKELDEFDRNKKIGYDKEERKLQEAIGQKLQALNNYYKFPEDIHKFYLHLDKKFDIYAIEEACCICHSKIVDIYNSKSLVLNVPVFPEDHLTGGRVAVCTYCSKGIPMIHSRISRLIREYSLHECICAETRESYLIDADEHMMRTQYEVPKGELPPEYYCPAVAYH